MYDGSEDAPSPSLTDSCDIQETIDITKGATERMFSVSDKEENEDLHNVSFGSLLAHAITRDNSALLFRKGHKEIKNKLHDLTMEIRPSSGEAAKLTAESPNNSQEPVLGNSLTRLSYSQQPSGKLLFNNE